MELIKTLVSLLGLGAAAMGTATLQGETPPAAALAAALTAAALAAATVAYHWRHAVGSQRPHAGTLIVPGALPLIGNALQVFPNIHRIHDWLADQCRSTGRGGATLAFTLPLLRTFYCVADPAVLEWVLKTRMTNYVKGQVVRTNLGPVLGSGIFAVDGKEWRWQRKLAARIFSISSFKQYVSEVFSAKADLLLARLAAACPQGPIESAAADGVGAPVVDCAGSAAGLGAGFQAACGGGGDAAAALGVVPGGAVDIQDVSYRFTLDAFCHIGFGTDPGCLSAAGRLPFAAAFDRAQRTTITRFWVPCWRLWETLDGRGRQLRRDVATIRSFAAAIIAQRRRALETTRAATQPQPQPERDDDADEISQLQRAEVGGSSCGAASCDLLGLFMSEEGPDGAPLGDSALVDAVLNFIIAGRDTTAQALSWTLYEVMRHPEVESKILSEADAVLGPLRRPCPADTNPLPAPAPSGRPGGDPTCAPAAGGVGQDGGGAGGEAAAAPLSYERLRALRYARAVFLEGLRLHPSVPQDVKFALCSDVLPCGTRVPAGAMVLYSAYAINRMMEFWGPDADEFRPERWEEMARTPPAYSYPTFNAGPRACLGQRLAELEGVCALVLLLRRFRLRPAEGCTARYDLSVSLPIKGGLWVHVEERAAAPPPLPPPAGA